MRAADLNRIRLTLARSAHFGSLPPGVRDRLASLARLRQARHGERLGDPETRDGQLWIVVSGAVRVSTHPKADEREVVYAVLGPGSYFGLANAVRHGPYTYDARAFGASELAVVDGGRLMQSLEQHPRLWRRVSGLMANRLRVSLDFLADGRVLSLPERVARRLLSHAMSTELPEGAQPAVQMTQADLALMLNSARSKINLTLKRLEAQGLVRTGYRSIVLLDVPGLRRLAGRKVHAL